MKCLCGNELTSGDRPNSYQCRQCESAAARREAKAVIGCLLTLLDEDDETFRQVKANPALWDIVLKARDWENKNVTQGEK